MYFINVQNLHFQPPKELLWFLGCLNASFLPISLLSRPSQQQLKQAEVVTVSKAAAKARTIDVAAAVVLSHREDIKHRDLQLVSADGMLFLCLKALWKDTRLNVVRWRSSPWGGHMKLMSSLAHKAGLHLWHNKQKRKKKCIGLLESKHFQFSPPCSKDVPWAPCLEGI